MAITRLVSRERILPSLRTALIENSRAASEENTRDGAL